MCRLFQSEYEEYVSGEINMMIIILGILAYFIIGGIILGILVNIMTKINDDLKDNQDYDSLYNIDNIGIIGILWPISVPLLIGLAIIAIVSALINIIAGFFIKTDK